MTRNNPNTKESTDGSARRCLDTAGQCLREINTENLFLEAAVSELLSARENYHQAASKALYLIRSVPTHSERDRVRKRNAMQLLVACLEAAEAPRFELLHTRLGSEPTTEVMTR